MRVSYQGINHDVTPSINKAIATEVTGSYRGASVGLVAPSGISQSGNMRGLGDRSYGYPLH